MANNLSAFNSEAWSLRLVEKLDQVNIMLPLVNRNWEGDLRQNKSVKIRTPGNISMASYTRGTTISYQDLVPALETFTVNDGEYFAFEVDDIDRAQSDINAMDVYMKRAVVAMNNTVEAKLLSAYTLAPGYNQITAGSSYTVPTTGIGTGATATATVTNGVVTGVNVSSAGSGYTNGIVIQFLPATDGHGWGATATATVTEGAVATGAATVTNGGYGYTTAPTVRIVDAGPITLTADTASVLSGSTGIYEQIMQAAFILDQNNVPRDGRFLIVDPYARTLIQNDTAHFVRYGQMGDRIVQTAKIGDETVARTAAQAPGYIGEILDFGVYVTPHVPTDGGGNRYLVFGDPEAITYAAQITEIEALRLQTTFANAVRGLLLHDVFVPMEASKRLGTIKVPASQ